jgi:hypothetical protein
MKTTLAFLLTISFLAFAGEKYGVYDPQGNRIAAFEAESHELPEKVRQAMAKESGKNLYISSISKGKVSKPSSRYRFKTGSYIEAAKKETFAICPPVKTEGTWISEHSVSLNAENCVSVQTPNLAGTFRVLFMENSGRTDTVQVLVGQSYIQMNDYSHKIYVPNEYVIDSMIRSVPRLNWTRSSFDVLPGNYENRKYGQSLIVDKTKFTMGDAQYYLKTSNIIKPKIIKWDMVYPNEKFEESQRPYIGGQEFRFANERSKKEGLDTAYRIVDFRGYKNKKDENLMLLGDPYAVDASHTFLAIDTSASGYRLPFDDEWSFLMRAGASTRYYWGDQEDSLTVSRYEWVRPVGLKPVAKLLPNKFGLYDMAGIAGEPVVARKTGTTNNDMRYEYYDTGFSGCNRCPESVFMEKIMTVTMAMRMPSISQTCTLKKREPGKEEADLTCKDIEPKPKLVAEKAGFGSFRLIRKTPKLQKLDKF